MNTPLTPDEPMQDKVIRSLFRDFEGDETGGRHAIRGFSFQVWQAVLETLRAHASGADYAIVLEWQQDIAILNSSVEPTEVAFVQLKKNETSVHWTFPSLIKAEANADIEVEVENSQGQSKKKKPKKIKPSILAKLYAHRIRFRECDKAELVFASNAKYDIELDGEIGSKIIENVRLLDISQESVVKLSKAFRSQLGLPGEEVIDLKDFSLRITECPVEEGYKYLVGELAELCLFKKIQPNVTSPLRAIVLIASYVQLRSGKLKHAKNFTQLLERSITRDEVDSFFVAANDNEITTQELVEDFVGRLNIEHAKYQVIKGMRREVTRACTDITNRTSFALQFLVILKRIFHENNEYPAEDLMKNVITAWLKEFRQLNVTGAHLYTDEYIYCLMAMIIEDAKSIQHLPPIPVDSQFEDEK
jgi:hypothetical protein